MDSGLTTTRDHVHGHLANVPVVMNLSHYSRKQVDLLFSWLEIWLQRRCKSDWSLEVLEDRSKNTVLPSAVFLKINFQDAGEAIYFKLSPEFAASQHGVVKASSFVLSYEMCYI